jgi:hypothetical protein
MHASNLEDRRVIKVGPGMLAAQAGPAFAPKKVLIIDDDAVILKTTSLRKLPCLAAGAVAFFPKPIEHESLLLAVKNALEPDAQGLKSTQGPVLDVGL